MIGATGVGIGVDLFNRFQSVNIRGETAYMVNPVLKMDSARNITSENDP